MSYNDIAWLPLAAGLTVLGLLLSYWAYRRSGVRPALRGAAVSLLPIAAYLTGALEMFWKIGVAIGQFGTGFVFDTTKWAGIGVTGLAIALFLAAGGRARRKASRQARREARAGREDAGLDTPGRDAARGSALGASSRTGAGTAAGIGTGASAEPTRSRTPVPVTREPAAAARPAKASRRAEPVDDDMKDIEDILRKRGL